MKLFWVEAEHGFPRGLSAHSAATRVCSHDLEVVHDVFLVGFSQIQRDHHDGRREVDFGGSGAGVGCVRVRRWAGVVWHLHILVPWLAVARLKL